MSIPKRLKYFDQVCAAGVALVAFAVYLATKAPSIGYWDSAELAAAGSTLGIAHPTGYPLFTLLSRAVVSLGLGITPYASLNVLAAVLTACAVFLFFILCLKLLRSDSPSVFGNRGVSPPQPAGYAGTVGSAGSKKIDRIAAATASLLFAFSRVVWSEGVSTEVYALHLVFFLGATLLFIRALERPGSSHRWLLFAFLLGLSFSHHMMTVLLAPAFLFLFFNVFGFGRDAWRRIAFAAPVFALGLTPYLYLPLRAAADPIVNWGNPTNFERFWTHVSAAQYRFKMFSSPDVAIDKLIAFIRDLPVSFTSLPLVFAVVGLWVLVRRGGRLFPFTLLVFVTCVLYAINYDFDDPNFYLHAHAMVAVWAAIGVRALVNRATDLSPTRTMRWVGGALCLVTVLIPFDSNFHALDRSSDYAVEDYARTVLSSVEPNAMILSGDLEGLVLGARYLQVAEGFRPDVAVVGLGTLAFPWYHEELEVAYPGLLRGTESARAVYGPLRIRLQREDTVLQADAPESFSALYNLAYTRFVSSLVRENIRRRPVYSSFVPAGFFGDARAVPQGLLLRLTRDSLHQPFPAPSLPMRPIPTSLPYADKVRAGYASGFLNHAVFRLARGDSAGVVAAVAMLETVVDLDSGNAQARDILRILKTGR